MLVDSDDALSRGRRDDGEMTRSCCDRPGAEQAPRREDDDGGGRAAAAEAGAAVVDVETI